MTPASPPPPRPRRRAPGRPGSDSPDLRSKLLDTAVNRFSRQGIAGTSLRSIATEAGVNPALLHYYFGDKAQLQEAVIEERLAPAAETIRQALQGADDDIQALVAGFVRGVGAAVAQYPWLPSLWVREVLSEGGALREVLLTRIGPLLPQMLAARFARAQRDGEINAGLDPRLLVVSLVGLTLFPAASAPIWRQLFGADDIKGDLDDQHLHDHTLALLKRGIRVD